MNQAPKINEIIDDVPESSIAINVHEQENNLLEEKTENLIELELRKFILNQENLSFLDNLTGLNNCYTEISNSSNDGLDNINVIPSGNNEKLQDLNEIDGISNVGEELIDENSQIKDVVIPESSTYSGHENKLSEIETCNPYKLSNVSNSDNENTSTKQQFDNFENKTNLVSIDIIESMYDRFERKIENENVIVWYCKKCKLSYQEDYEKCNNCLKKLKVICQKCEKYFTNYRVARRHEVEVCEPRELFKCRICNFTSKRKDRIRQHIIRQHDTSGNINFDDNS